ncbi:MADS-box transcription factor PHERES 1-like [Camellia sinensis]|uniref:MADS-box transcription factor PHERES 1-like n=1 Tax=Camellia sinensis TaxID=4442 RepID=UPI0010358752|nr:MADS-box transcription factor PHERES 1-like [Camellia sinensis]
MGRTVKYEFIADERVRKQTFRKRKAGLLKKDLLLNRMFGLLQMKHPICSKGFENLPSMKQTAKMMDQEKFLKKNVTRMSKNLDKEKRKIRGLKLNNK